jgi:gamma-glutamyltranspeptidase/glutathione hydrolase
MDDFTTKPGAKNAMGLIQGERNAITPGKRMLSSMTPTLVLDSTGAIQLVTGAAGGAHIITGVAHQIVALIDFHKSLGDAMAAPQFHFQDQPDSLVVEKVAWADTAAAMMTPFGHGVTRSKWDLMLSMQSIHREGAKWVGVSEPRGFGLAKGY